MSLSSVFVIGNALRLKGLDLNNKKTKIEKTKKGDLKMEKNLKIDGMMCNHCVMHVQKALSKIDGVEEVTVSLDEKNAKVKLSCAISDETFKNVIEENGYTLIRIE